MQDDRTRAMKDVWTLAKKGVELNGPIPGFNKELKESLTPERDFIPDSRMGRMGDSEFLRLRRAVTTLAPYWEGRASLKSDRQARTLLGALALSRTDARSFILIRDYVTDSNSPSGGRELKCACDVKAMRSVAASVRRILHVSQELRNPLFMPQLDTSDHEMHDAAQLLSLRLWSHCVRQSTQRVLGTLLFMPDHGRHLLGALKAVEPLYVPDEQEEWDVWSELDECEDIPY